jgi:hypothetical protein
MFISAKNWPIKWRRNRAKEARLKSNVYISEGEFLTTDLPQNSPNSG